MSKPESSSTQSNHQMHAVNALRKIRTIAQVQYAIDQNNPIWPEIIEIANHAIKENQ